MLLKLLLGLRNNAQQVEVVRINGEKRPVLGRTHPQEEGRRAAVLRHWGIAAASPRQEPPATIDEALPQRTRTILSHRLPAELQQRIDSGTELPPESRLKNRPGHVETAPLMPPDIED